MIKINKIFIILVLFSQAAFSHDPNNENEIYLELKCKQYDSPPSTYNYSGHESLIINANLKKMTGSLDWDGIKAEFDEIIGHKLVFRNSVTYYAFNKITMEIKSSSFLFLCTKVNDS